MGAWQESATFGLGVNPSLISTTSRRSARKTEISALFLQNPYPPNHRSNRSVYQDVPARGVQCCPAVTFAFSMVSAVRMKAVRATLLRIPARQHSLLKDSRHRIISAGSQRDHVGSSTHMWCESSPIFLFHMSHSSQVCDIIHIVKILVRRMAKEGVVTSPS